MADSTRRNFRCQFLPYVTVDNREGIIRSVIAQFEGYNSNPEITSEGNESFTLTVTLNDELTATLVRDKLLFNYFIDRVSVSEVVRVLRKKKKLPNSTKSAFFDSFDLQDEPEQAVDEHLEYPAEAHEEYKIDLGDRPDGPPVVHKEKPKVLSIGSKKLADAPTEPQKEGLPGVFFGDPRPEGDVRENPLGITPEDLSSDVNDVTASNIFNSSLHLADADDAGAGGQFGMGTDVTNIMVSLGPQVGEFQHGGVDEPVVRNPIRRSFNEWDGIGSTTSWFTDDILAEETIKPNPNAESPLSQVDQSHTLGHKRFSFSEKPIEDKDPDQPTSTLDMPFYGDPLQGGGWSSNTSTASSLFGLNDSYNYIENEDDEL
jgi:hypothetical protein